MHVYFQVEKNTALMHKKKRLSQRTASSIALKKNKYKEKIVSLVASKLN